jgi:cytochrome c
MTPMNSPPTRRFLRNLTILGLASSAWLAHGQALDVAAAEALAKKSNCTKCHSVDKKKDGPSFKETAAKYKGQADAEAKLTKHITTGPKIKIDGVEEEHQMVKTKDPAEIKNLVRYVLSR